MNKEEAREALVMGKAVIHRGIPAVKLNAGILYDNSGKLLGFLDDFLDNKDQSFDEGWTILK